MSSTRISSRLFLTILLNVAISLSQIIGYFFSGSLSLLSDALHNFSDVVSLVVSWIAAKIALKKNNLKATFGYQRSEVLAAFVNTGTLLLVALFLIKESVERFVSQSHPVMNVKWIIIGAMVGILGNFLSVLLLHEHSHDNINVKSSYLHLLSDLFSSIAVLASGLLMYFFDVMWVDSLLSLMIAAYLLVISYKLFQKTFNILMQFSPITISPDDIVAIYAPYPEIENIHHLHIWEMTNGRAMLMAHVDFRQNVDLKTANALMQKLEQQFKDKYNIFEVNLQAEFEVNDDKSLIVMGKT